jgi:hypothetical protein
MLRLVSATHSLTTDRHATVIHCKVYSDQRASDQTGRCCFLYICSMDTFLDKAACELPGINLSGPSEPASTPSIIIIIIIINNFTAPGHQRPGHQRPGHQRPGHQRLPPSPRRQDDEEVSIMHTQAHTSTHTVTLSHTSLKSGRKREKDSTILRRSIGPVVTDGEL